MPLTNPNFPTKSELLGLINQYLVTNGTILATEHNEIETALVNAIYGGQVGDIKEIAANDAYIVANFQTGTSNINEGLGLVNGERYGWAICNGKNGTINKMGKVAIGYDPSLYPLGSVAGSTTGGFKDAVVIEHSHYTTLYGSVTGDNNSSLYDAPGANVSTNKERPLTSAAYDQNSNAYDYELTTSNGTANAGKTNTVGISGTNRNMQPYIVTLFIQRIPV